MMSSLRTRLLVAIGALAVTAVVAVAIAARQTTRVEFQRFAELEKAGGGPQDATTIDTLARSLDGHCCDDADVGPAAGTLEHGVALLVIDDADRLRVARGFPPGVGPSDLSATFQDGTLRVSGAPATSDGARSVAEGLSMVIRGGPMRSITLADGRRATLHLIRLPDQGSPAVQVLGAVDKRLLAATSLVAILALAAAWIVSRRMMQPIAELREATRDLGRGDLARRVSVSGADELAGLAQSFNAMATELERQQTIRRGLVNDVAHELRTPLTALRCRIETAIDGLGTDPRTALTQMNEDVGHLSQLVSDLEDLARAEAGDLGLTIGDLAVEDVFGSALRASALEQDARIATEVPRGLRVKADVVRLRQILVNLLTNAERHTPADGKIRMRAEPRGAEVSIEVHNTGSQLAPDELERIFDRFYRADPSRQRATGGRGLGLAIVKHLTEAQGGRVWARSDGGGVTVGVALPAGSAAVSG